MHIAESFLCAQHCSQGRRPERSRSCCGPAVLRAGHVKDPGLNLRTQSSVVPNFRGGPYSLGNIIKAVGFLPRKKYRCTQDICLPVSLSPCWLMDPRTRAPILYSREKQYMISFLIELASNAHYISDIFLTLSQLILTATL